MTNKKRGLSLVSVLLASLFSVLIIGGTVTFARFYGDYEKKNEVRVAGAVAKLQTDSIYRTDTEGTRISVSFDPTSDSAVIKDVEPEDVIDYYFTVTGADGKKENEVSLNVTVCVSVRLEMISSGKTGVETYYFCRLGGLYRATACVRVQVFSSITERKAKIRPISVRRRTAAKKWITPGTDWL